ncbi:cobalt-precorrin-6A reductase [Acidocella sp.]|uniref:cobalt-precorrin-6A reductase n=1 Tax=Acidocella sp. TaxID=50710 RepID=UPI00179E5370|nr:cobalt-precorrin-6A reductase [Acidocella sp.]NNM57590.1 cobalt-precorrin-6A reductase [Acidocella sp.]
MPQLKLLILGGTGEASALAALLAGNPDFSPTLSLAGRTAAPRLPEIPWRRGGFGGIPGLTHYLLTHGIQALIVATHPFAVQMRANAAAAARATKIPVLMIERPAWQAETGDHWVPVPGMAEAAAALGRTQRRVLLTIGRKDLAPFVAAAWHDYTIRSVDAPPSDALPPRANIITARGPFTEAADRQMLIEHRIEIIVTKNSGGKATSSKLLAARALKLPIIMVARPAWPDITGLNAATTEDAPGALAWLEAIRHAASPAKRGV